jgi:hypothetical protein
MNILYNDTFRYISLAMFGYYFLAIMYSPNILFVAENTVSAAAVHLCP